MGSMAFWYTKITPDKLTDELNGDIQQPEIDPNHQLKAVMNFNLWTQCDKTSESFLDIGFMLENITAAEKIYYYIPFANAQVDDLSLLINNSKIIGAIFNEKYSTLDIPGKNRFWPVQNDTGKNSFVIYSWKGNGKLRAVEFVPYENTGGLLEIDVKSVIDQIEGIPCASFSKNDCFYFRFRVNIPNPKQHDTIVREYTPPNSFLQSTLATTYIVDFRFNDLRSLPDSIIDELTPRNHEFVHVKKLHFLLMTKAHVDVETGVRDFSLRELEEKTWDEYIQDKFETKDIVAYHCAEKRKEDEPPIKQWEFFAKIKVNKSTKKVLGLYFIVLLITSVLFNLLSSFLWQQICCFLSNKLSG